MLRTATRRAVTRRHAATRRKASPTRRRNGKKSNATRRKQAVKAVVGLLGSGLTVAGILAIAHKYKKSEKASKASASASKASASASKASASASSTASTGLSPPDGSVLPPLQPRSDKDLRVGQQFQVNKDCQIRATEKPNELIPKQRRFRLWEGENFQLIKPQTTRTRIQRLNQYGHRLSKKEFYGWVNNNDILHKSTLLK